MQGTPVIVYSDSDGKAGPGRRIGIAAGVLRSRRLVNRELVAEGQAPVRLTDLIAQLHVSPERLLEEEGEDAEYVRSFLIRSGHTHPYVLGLLALRAREHPESLVDFYRLLRRGMESGHSIVEDMGSEAFVATAVAVARGDPGEEGRDADPRPWLFLHRLGPDAARLAYHAARFSGHIAHALAIGAVAASRGHRIILCEHYSMPAVERPLITEVRQALLEIGAGEGCLDEALPYLIFE